VRIDHQRGQRLVVLRRRQPAHRINKADALDGHLLTPSRLDHHQANTIVNQRKHGELFEHPVDCFALEHIEPHGGRYDPRHIWLEAVTDSRWWAHVQDDLAAETAKLEQLQTLQI
jgi:hypothetical protein